MRYILKRVCALSLVLAMALSFTACGKKVGDIKLDSGVNAIYIDEDGAVSYGVTEKFADKDYDKDALEKYINDEVKNTTVVVQHQLMMLFQWISLKLKIKKLIWF